MLYAVAPPVTVIVAGVLTFIVPLPRSTFPPSEFIVVILIPVIEARDLGFQNPLIDILSS